MLNTVYFVTKTLIIIWKKYINEGLLIINKLDIQWDSYFELYIIYYFQLLIKKKKIMYNEGLLIIKKLERVNPIDPPC